MELDQDQHYLTRALAVDALNTFETLQVSPAELKQHVIDFTLTEEWSEPFYENVYDKYVHFYHILYPVIEFPGKIKP